MTKQLILATVIVSLLGGTIVGQKKTDRPPIPSTFRGIDATAPADQTSIGDLKWFEVFKDEELQNLVRTAMVQNYDLRAALARINAARANLGLARAAQFPQVEASADLTSTHASGRTSNIGSVLLNFLSFEVDIWGRVRQQRNAARAELRASAEDRKAAMTTVVSDVATGYFSLIELDSELEIDKRTLAARQESLRIIKSRQQGGLATMLDVRQAEELVYQASQTIPDTERAIEQTENLISLLLGNNPGSISRGRPLSQQEGLPSVPAGLPSSLLSGVWSFIPQITAPIFTAGRLKSNVKFAKAQQELALVQYQQTIQTAFREVSDALVQYRKVKEIRAQQELLVTTLQDRSRLAHLRYEGGVDSLLNALDADRELFNAELSLAQTKRNELLSLVQLYKALGGGWQQ